MGWRSVTLHKMIDIFTWIIVVQGFGPLLINALWPENTGLSPVLECFQSSGQTASLTNQMGVLLFVNQSEWSIVACQQIRKEYYLHHQHCCHEWRGAEFFWSVSPRWLLSCDLVSGQQTPDPSPGPLQHTAITPAENLNKWKIFCNNIVWRHKSLFNIVWRH